MRMLEESELRVAARYSVIPFLLNWIYTCFWEFSEVASRNFIWIALVHMHVNGAKDKLHGPSVFNKISSNLVWWAFVRWLYVQCVVYFHYDFREATLDMHHYCRGWMDYILRTFFFYLQNLSSFMSYKLIALVLTAMYEKRSENK